MGVKYKSTLSLLQGIYTPGTYVLCILLIDAPTFKNVPLPLRLSRNTQFNVGSNCPIKRMCEPPA